MGLRINQNISAMNAARNLRSTNSSMSKSLERLSSGYRINRAADDPAGMIISENLRAQIAGLGQAIKNSDNAVNVIKTSEAALDEVLKQLRSIRTLALDALTTGSSDATARAADQVQIDSSIETIDRIGNTTQYGTIKLLNGDSGVKGSANSDDLAFISGTNNTKTSGSTGFGVTVNQLATQGTVSFKINNEFQTADNGTAGGLQLGGAFNTTGFYVVFGDRSGGDALTATEIKELGAALKAGGLVDDTSKTGVSVSFNEADATAFVALNESAYEDVTQNDLVNSALLTNINDSSLGTAVRVTAASENAGVDSLNVTGRYAGLEFSVQDMVVAGAAAGIVGTTRFTAADGAAVKATARLTDAGGNTAQTHAITIDFGVGATTTAGREAIATSLRAAGLTDVTDEATVADASTMSVALSETGATAGVVTLTTKENGVNMTEAKVAAAANRVASASNLGRFIKFAVDTNQLTAVSSIQAKIDDSVGVMGFTAGKTTTSPTALASTEVTTLAGNAYGATGALGTDLAVGISEVKTVGELLTINESSVVTIASGTALTSVVSRIRSVIDADDLKLKVTFSPDTTAGASGDNTFTFTNTEFGSTKNDIKSTRGNALFHQLGVGTDPVNVQGKDVAGTINDVQATGDGQFLTLDSKGDEADGVKVKYTGTALPVSALKAYTVQGSLLFQIGANAGQTVTQAISDTRARKLGRLATGLVTSAKSVADVSVLTSNGAKDALNLVDNAITDITTLRGKLGAFQMNILEANINSLGVAQESLASAESVIRDADFADETVAFTRTQILLQAGTAILTQANAIPQAVLQLLA